MAIWMEIRCEGRGEGRSGKDACWSDENSGPMGGADETQQGVINCLKFLANEALQSNWVRRKNGFYCPACAKLKAWELSDAQEEAKHG